MVHLRLRRLLPFLRVLALALFALGLVLQPVMAAVGEMHELAHDPSGTHSHDLHVDELDAELATAGAQNQGGAKTLHVLLPFSRGCGATAALLPVVNPLNVISLSGRLALAPATPSLQGSLTPQDKPPHFMMPRPPPDAHSEHTSNQMKN